MNIKNTDIESLKKLTPEQLTLYDRSAEDGRLKVLQKHIDGNHTAIFNREPYDLVDITEEQFEKYKPFVTLQPDYELEGIVEYYSNIFDTGVPRWFDWLCGR